MPVAARLFVIAILLAVPAAALADEGYYPIKADDGEIIANHRVTVENESQVEQAPGIVVVGNPHGDVTLIEFYDVNCTICRADSPEIEALLKSNKELRLVLVPF